MAYLVTLKNPDYFGYTGTTRSLPSEKIEAGWFAVGAGFVHFLDKVSRLDENSPFTPIASFPADMVLGIRKVVDESA